MLKCNNTVPEVWSEHKYNANVSINSRTRCFPYIIITPMRIRTYDCITIQQFRGGEQTKTVKVKTFPDSTTKSITHFF